MDPDESPRKRLLRQVTGDLEQALHARYGAIHGPKCLPVALNVLRFKHLAESDLSPWREDVARWLDREWPTVKTAVATSDEVTDCVAVLRAREAGVGTGEFDAFLGQCWNRLGEKLRPQGQSDPVTDSEPADEDMDSALELAQARLFRSVAEAQAIHQRLCKSEGDDSAPKRPAKAYRGKTTGHHFLDALLDYDPEKGGYWRSFLEERFQLKLRDALKALPPRPEWIALPENGDAPAGCEAGQTAEDAPDSPGMTAPGPHLASAGEATDESFRELRRRLWRRLSATKKGSQSGTKSGSPAWNEADQALAIFELTYTSWIDPATYLPPTVQAVETVAQRLLAEAELRQLQAVWWPPQFGTPPWNELLTPAAAIPVLVAEWTRIQVADLPADEAETKTLRAAIQTELEAASKAPPETDRPLDLRQAARCCLARAAALSRYPALDRLRRDFAEAGELFSQEEDRLKGSRDAQIQAEDALRREIQEALADGLSYPETKDALALGRKLVVAKTKAHPMDAARIEELLRVLKEDDQLREGGGQPLGPVARRKLEHELFTRWQHSAPIEALKRWLNFVQYLLREGAILVLGNETRLPPVTLDRLRRQLRHLQITLASARMTEAEIAVENLAGPDGNLRRHRERRKFKEPDQTPPVRQDRSDRFWVRAQKEVLQLLPGLSQPTLARRLKLFETLLDELVEEGDPGHA